MGKYCRADVEAIAMKHVNAALYSNVTPEVVQADGTEQVEGFTAGPIGDKLVVRFKKVANVA